MRLKGDGCCNHGAVKYVSGQKNRSAPPGYKVVFWIEGSELLGAVIIVARLGQLLGLVIVGDLPNRP